MPPLLGVIPRLQLCSGPEQASKRGIVRLDVGFVRLVLAGIVSATLLLKG